MIPLILAGLLAATGDTIATACVLRHGDQPTPQRLEAVRRALQARVAKRGIRVVICNSSAIEDWSIAIDEHRGIAELDIRGKHIIRSERVDLTGLTELEAVQMMALTAAEAIRPAVDRLMLELGSSEQPENDWAEREPREPPAAHRWPETPIVDAQPPPSPPVRASRRSRPFIGALAGPVLDDRRQLFGWFELQGGIPVSALTITGHAGIKETGDHVRHGVDIDRRTYEFGLGAEHAFGSVTLAAQLRLRVHHVDTDAFESHTYVGSGVALSVLWSLWRTSALDLGLAAQGWFWPQPRRLFYQGSPLVTESFVEVFVGPTLRVFLPF